MFKDEYRVVYEHIKPDERLITDTIRAAHEISEETKITKVAEMRRMYIMKKKVAGRNKMNRFSKIGISAAAAFATVVLCLNALPPLARAADNVPVLSTIVDALTFGRFSGQDGRSGYDITVPQISGLSDTELEDALNELLL
ncbi:MAG: hypothetical protein LBM16_04450, partial [Clostridiales bacterium]|nr:hypothetical protein [Clostridiales bacterium]